MAARKRFRLRAVRVQGRPFGDRPLLIRRPVDSILGSPLYVDSFESRNLAEPRRRVVEPMSIYCQEVVEALDRADRSRHTGLCGVRSGAARPVFVELARSGIWIRDVITSRSGEGWHRPPVEPPRSCLPEERAGGGASPRFPVSTSKMADRRSASVPARVAAAEVPPSPTWSRSGERSGRRPKCRERRFGGVRRAGFGPVTGPRERPLTAKPAFDPTTVAVERPPEPPRLADQPRLQRRLHHLAAGDFDAVGGGTGT